MTRKIYEQRKNDLIKNMAEWSKAGRYNEARVTYGRLCELIEITYCIEGIISAEQYHADNKQASDCFYDNL